MNAVKQDETNVALLLECQCAAFLAEGPVRLACIQRVIDPAGDSKTMQQEIFGSAMVIKAYNSIDAVTAEINNRPRPLVLCYFGKDEAEQRQVRECTISGVRAFSSSATCARFSRPVTAIRAAKGAVAAVQRASAPPRLRPEPACQYRTHKPGEEIQS